MSASAKAVRPPFKGTHGSEYSGTVKNIAIDSLAEGFGTAVLTFMIITAVITAFVAGLTGFAPIALVAVMVVFVLGGLIFRLGPVSGAHMNPLLSLGLGLCGKLPAPYVLPYLVAQFIGGYLGAWVARWVFADQWQQAMLGVTKAAAGIDDMHVMVIEGLLCLIFGFVVAGTADDKTSTAIPAWAVSSTLGSCILAGGLYTGAGLNPARTLGPMLVTGTYTALLAYLVGQFVGGAIGVALGVSISGGKEPSEAEADTP